jgi:uncharacterized protein
MSSAALPAPRASRRLLALRFLQLLLGLLGWGTAVTLFIRSRLGLGPWDAFHYGIHVQAGISVGAASIVVGLVIVLLTTLFGIRPGLGTLLNMLLIGAFIDLLMPVVPDAASLPLAAAFFGGGIIIAGLSSGAYIGAGFGQGPRDTLMVALVTRSGWSVRRIRTAIEVVVLAAGWAMGGTVGIGTLIIALTIGHAVQWGMRLFNALPPVSTAPPGPPPV